VAPSHRIEMTFVGDLACRLVKVVIVVDWAQQRTVAAAIAPAAVMVHCDIAAEHSAE
jgi:hypothetical protein